MRAAKLNPKLTPDSTPGLAVYALLASAALITVAFGNGQLDLLISDNFFDITRGVFLGSHEPVIDLYLYRGMKLLMLAIALSLIVWGLYQIRRRAKGFSHRELWLGVSGTLLIPLTMALLKRATGLECPWSMDRYGGPEPTLTVMEALLQLDGHGQCFPAGHASGGFYLFAWAVAVAGFSPTGARVIAAAGLLSGLVMGLTRVAQGAHFLSHVLWSAWVSVALTLILAKLILKSVERPAHTR